MKKILLTLAFAAVFGGAAQAQYFSTTQGKTFKYVETDKQEKEVEKTDVTAVIESVETAENGVITAVEIDSRVSPFNPMSELKTKRVYTYDPTNDITTVEVMSADEFKSNIITMFKEQAAAAGQHISEMDLEELSNAMSAKGKLEFKIDPKAAEGSKLGNSTIRMTMAQMASSSMTMNLWQGKYLGAETITTEAGTFDCVKVSYVIRMSATGGNSKQDITEWYAKGIGLVRSIVTDKKGEILVEEVLTAVE